MQVIDNLTRLRGQVQGCAPDPARAGYRLLALRVDAAEPVAGRADLLGRHVGGVLDVAVRDELLNGRECIGARIDLRAKMTPGGALAEPHPAPGDFNFEPP